MKKVFITLLLFGFIGADAQTTLDNYIKTALANNETIRQQQFLLAPPTLGRRIRVTFSPAVVTRYDAKTTHLERHLVKIHDASPRRAARPPIHLSGRQ